jgi:hypothetical protein
MSDNRFQEPPTLPEDTPSSGSTNFYPPAAKPSVPTTPRTAQPIVPAPPAVNNQPIYTSYQPNERPKKRSRQKSGLYLPLWSVLLMLFSVFLVTFGVIGLVIVLGGNRQPSGNPRIIIITSEPTVPFAATAGDNATPLPTSGLLPSDGSAGAFPTFALEGPTLVPVIISPTPLTIAVGATVVITDDDVRLRSQPSLEGEELALLRAGTLFTIIGDAQQGSSITWWQVEDPTAPLTRGWVAAQYLRVQPSIPVIPTP